MPLSSPSRKPYFNNHLPALDLLRAVAIISVMLYHFLGSFDLPRDSYIVRFFLWGKHGVDLFFVLSGFLIGGQIIESSFRNAFDFKLFYFKRSLRIFPAYYSSIFVYALLFYFMSGGNLFNNAGTMHDLKIHLLYLQNYLDPAMYGGMYWSLAVEEQFYILIPVLLFLIIGYNHKLLVPAFLLAVASSVAATYFFYDHSDKWWVLFMDHNIRGFSSLIAGVITAYTWVRYRERLETMSFAVSLSLLAVSLALLITSYSADYSLTAERHYSFWHFIPTACGFGCLILFLSIKPISFPWRRLTGKIAQLSYTMYLYHALIAIFFIKVLNAKGLVPDRGSILSFAVFFLLYFLLACLLCQIMYLVIESPTMRIRAIFVKNWSRSERQQSPTNR